VQVHITDNKAVPGPYIPLRNSGSNIFETVSPVKAGSRFKMEIKNSTECYIYVFGKETDGTSYTLFPYPSADNPTKTKYSPFCGIAGYRLFPRDKSMSPDSIGTKDYLAVVVSRDTLDWFELNKKISEEPGKDYAARFNSALSDKMIRNIQFRNSSQGTMAFTTDGGEGRVVACIVEIDK